MMEAGERPPHAAMLQLLTTRWLTDAIGSAARLGIADHLGDTPQRAEEIAPKIKADANALHRLLRVLALGGVVQEIPGKGFTLTPLGGTLRSDAQTPMKAFATYVTEVWHNRVYEKIDDAVAGKYAFEAAHGMQGYPWLDAHPQEAASFHQAMSDLTKSTTPVVTMAYDFGTAKTVCDVGGGEGQFLSAILRAAPNTRAILFDRPQAIERAKSLLRDQDRISFVAGDAREEVPKGADTYVFKHVFHNWSDDDCVRFAQNVARVLPADGRLLVIEQLMPAEGERGPAPLLDLTMMLMTPGGRERTVEEFAAIFGRAGLKLARVVPTRSPSVILEATR